MTELFFVGTGAPARTWLRRDERGIQFGESWETKRERNKTVRLFFLTGIFVPQKRI